MHVTLRSASRSLRHPFVFPTVRGAIQSLQDWRPEGFRVVEFSVQGNHAHFIVEASDAKAFSSGMRALTIRIARRVNRLLMRRGKVWADRFHSRALTSPRAVRRALLYVLSNFKKHTRGAGAALDACSSAPYFDGFSAPKPCLPTPTLRATSPPRTWLLRQGWKRHGLIGLEEAPAS